MNTQAAVFGICNPETGYGAGQGYPGVASEHLAAFYGAGGGGGSSGTSSAASSGGGGGASSGEPSSPSPYGSGSSGAGGQGAGSGSERHSLPETKYEPSHSPSSGLISSDNGLQYANLDTGAGPGELKGYPGSGYPSSGASHPGHQAYQAHHLVQSAYAHHYGTGHLGVNSPESTKANQQRGTVYFKALCVNSSVIESESHCKYLCYCVVRLLRAWVHCLMKLLI